MQGPVDVDVGAFEALMAGMARMNGGTNIALAVQKAGQLLKPLSATAHRVLVLLTDGRIDSHQVGRRAGRLLGRARVWGLGSTCCLTRPCLSSRSSPLPPWPLSHIPPTHHPPADTSAPSSPPTTG